MRTSPTRPPGGPDPRTPRPLGTLRPASGHWLAGARAPSALPHHCHSPSDYKKRVFERHVTAPRRRPSPLPSGPGELVSSLRGRARRHPRPRHVTQATIESRTTRREREASKAGSAELPPPPRPSWLWAEAASCAHASALRVRLPRRSPPSPSSA